LNLAVQIYFKHYLNDIPVYRINFLYLGNIFNILLSFIIILGVVLVHIINRGLEKAEYRLILFVVTIALSSYVLGIVIGKSNYLPLESYLLGYPARKVYLALIFSFNLFTHFYLLSYIWSILIGRQSGGAGKAFTGAFFAFILALAFSFYFVSKQDNRIHVTAATPHYDVSVVLGLPFGAITNRVRFFREE